MVIYLNGDLGLSLFWIDPSIFLYIFDSPVTPLFNEFCTGPGPFKLVIIGSPAYPFNPEYDGACGNGFLVG